MIYDNNKYFIYKNLFLLTQYEVYLFVDYILRKKVLNSFSLKSELWFWETLAF